MRGLPKWFNNICNILGYCMICSYAIAGLFLLGDKIYKHFKSPVVKTVEDFGDPNDPNRFKEV